LELEVAKDRGFIRRKPSRKGGIQTLISRAPHYCRSPERVTLIVFLLKDDNVAIRTCDLLRNTVPQPQSQKPHKRQPVMGARWRVRPKPSTPPLRCGCALTTAGAIERLFEQR
jgi:hypothetical protein